VNHPRPQLAAVAPIGAVDAAEGDLPEAFLRFIRALAEADEAEDYARRSAQAQGRLEPAHDRR
jgi:hypothetical protein